MNSHRSLQQDLIPPSVEEIFPPSHTVPSTSQTFHAQERSAKDVEFTREAFERLKSEHEAALTRIARLEKELEDYEIDLPPGYPIKAFLLLFFFVPSSP